jgi:predicted ABC-class ATPase
MADITREFRNRKDCNEALKKFSKEHYTFINQIFGDRTIRSYISKFYQNEDFIFKVEVVKSTSKFENDSHHHILASKNKITPYQHPDTGKWVDRDIVCSVASGYQDLDKNQNDTLCQSYSLLTFLGQPIDPDQFKKQMDMIQMYREFLENEKLKMKMKEIIEEPKNTELWRDYRVVSKPFLIMDAETIFDEIRKTLDKWETFGFYYFIGNGECPDSLFTNNKRLLEEESIPEEEEDENMSRRLRSRIVGGKK